MPSRKPEFTRMPSPASASPEGLAGIGGVRRDHAQDRQAVLGGEIEVALVVPRHGHDRAGAIIHQHEIGDVDRQVRAGERVRAVMPVSKPSFPPFPVRRRWCRPACTAR
jgi:hypothetical protein